MNSQPRGITCRWLVALCREPEPRRRGLALADLSDGERCTVRVSCEVGPPHPLTTHTPRPHHDAALIFVARNARAGTQSLTSRTLPCHWEVVLLWGSPKQNWVSEALVSLNPGA